MVRNDTINIDVKLSSWYVDLDVLVLLNFVW